MAIRSIVRPSCSAASRFGQDRADGYSRHDARHLATSAKPAFILTRELAKTLSYMEHYVNTWTTSPKRRHSMSHLDPAVVTAIGALITAIATLIRSIRRKD